MKKQSLVLTLIIFIFLNSCRKILSVDKEYNLPANYLFSLCNNDILTYKSNLNNTEIFVVDSIVNGEFYQSATGTCGKEPFDIFQFQSIYIRNINETINNYVSRTMDDCWVKPSAADYCINYVKGLVDVYSSNGINLDSEISWYDEFRSKVNNYNSYYDIITLYQNKFNNVFEFCTQKEIEVMNDNEIIKWYYTHKLGFVGYQKKSNEIFELIN